MKTVQTVIEPRKSWQLINWKEIVEYKDLFYFLVLRDIKVLYKQTVLGFAWAILNPLFQMIVFTVVFGRIAEVPSDGIPYPIFSFAAVVPWTYFAQSLTTSTNSLTQSASLFTKVYFPRLIIPMAPVFAKLLDFAIAFVILIIMMLFYGYYPTWQIIYIPLLLIIMVMTAGGMGMWLSALSVQYRDIRFAITFMTQLLMYVAPVVFPASLVAEKFGEQAYQLYGLFPMTGVIEGFRASLLDRPMPWDLIIPGAIMAIVLLITGAFYFRKLESKFADVA